MFIGKAGRLKLAAKSTPAQAHLAGRWKRKGSFKIAMIFHCFSMAWQYRGALAEWALDLNGGMALTRGTYICIL